MTWLFSLYWLGAFAVLGPIAFHLWRRMPRGERRFSTLMFLTTSPPRVTSRSRIEHWLLLMLRGLALLLLALAFTRPLWRTAVTQPDGTKDIQWIAVVVDTSASMRREGIWERLIRDLDDRIAALPPQTIVSLYRFDLDFLPIAGFSEIRSLEPPARRELIRGRLQELKPTWKETRLGEALVQAATLFQDVQIEASRPTEKLIWLASDLQSGSDLIALQGYEWPDDLSVELIPVHARFPSNAGVQFVERTGEADDSVPRIRVTNSADAGKELFKLKWDCPESAEAEVYVPPGQSRIVVPPQRPAGCSTVPLRLLGDDDEFDNRVFLAQAAIETRLVVFCGSDTANDIEGSRFYLERVFAAAPKFNVQLKESRELSADSRGVQPSLVILVQPELEMQSLLVEHLSRGGTVVVASPTAETLSESLKLLGRQDLAITEASVSKYAMLGDIQFEHPLFAPFAEAQFSDFTGIKFWKHRTIQKPADEASPALTQLDETDRVLARFDDGAPAIVEYQHERGRVIVFAAGWQPADSQFARSSKFPMLMYHLLEYSAGMAPRPGSEVVGHSINWPAATGQEKADVGIARLPDGSELTGLSLERPFVRTDQPGLYELNASGRTEQIAINLAPEESRTSPMSIEQLEASGLKWKSSERRQEKESRQARERQKQLAEIEQSQKLWRWVLFVMFGVLVLETLLGSYFAVSEKSVSTQGTA